MSATSKIEWTDATWNPVVGCSRVSPGCDHCYAMRMAHRFSGVHSSGPAPYKGLTRYRTFMGRDCDLNPRGIDHTKHQGVDWTGVVRFLPDKLDQPLHWRKPRRVFVCSMSDLFHEKVADEQIAAVFGVMVACPQHEFIVLTKRAKRMLEWFRWYEGSSGAGAHPFAAFAAAAEYTSMPQMLLDEDWPLTNVTVMVTCEDQQRADERVPLLLQCPAVRRGISYEPALGPIDVDEWLHSRIDWSYFVGPCKHGRDPWTRCDDGCDHSRPAIDHVIAGCESGHGARPADVAWFRSLRDQCLEAGVAYFLKQMQVDGELVKLPELDGKVWDEVPR